MIWKWLLFYFTFLLLPIFISPVLSETNQTNDKVLPAWIGEFKKLDEKELSQKKEGWYATGLPLFGSDPVAGRGLGLLANIFYNGTKSTPSFSFSPYEHLISVSAYQTDRSSKSYFVSWDAPYFLDSPFRLRSYVGYENSLHNLYFGQGKDSLAPLSYFEKNDPSARKVRNATFPEYEDANGFFSNNGTGREAVSTQRYNEYKFEATYAQFAIDKTIQKIFRVWGSTELTNNVVRKYDGKWTEAKDPIFSASIPVIENETRLANDTRSGKVVGSNGGYVNYLRAGIALDTRDFEPDPDRGWLIEYNVTRAERAIGSDYSYFRHFGQVKNYWQPFPKLFEELVIAQRVALTKADGSVPFFDYRYLFSIDGPFSGVGGQNTLRGYRTERFFGPVMGFYNIELRWRFGSFELWDNLFQFSLVPFYDIANVWDKLSEITNSGYKHSRGVGVRIIWDQSTVILMDWARSREDSLFYLDMGHTF